MSFFFGGSESGGGGSSPLNQIIDGQFNHWSKGNNVGLLNQSRYISDIFGAYSGSGGISTVSRQAFTLGQTLVPGNPSYYWQFDQSVAANGVELLYQEQENCAKFSGSNITIAFFGKVTSGTLDVTAAFIQNFGTGSNSPSPEVETQAGSAVTLTTTWQLFIVTIAVPSVSAKTIGDDADSDYFKFVLLADDAATTFTAQLANIGVLMGDAAFEGPWLSAVKEMDEINSYFRFISNSIAFFPNHTTATARRIELPIKEMVRVPTVSSSGSSNFSGSPTFSATKNFITGNGTATSATVTASINDLEIDARYQS